MARGRVDDPDGAVVVVDYVPYSAAAGYLVLPLFEISAVVSVGREVSAKPVLSLVVGPRPWVGPHDFHA